MGKFKASLEEEPCRFSKCDCERCVDAEDHMRQQNKLFFNKRGLLEDPNTGLVWFKGEWCDHMNTAEWLVFKGFKGAANAQI